jgi:hypothetical protein
MHTEPRWSVGGSETETLAHARADPAAQLLSQTVSAAQIAQLLDGPIHILQN